MQLVPSWAHSRMIVTLHTDIQAAKYYTHISFRMYNIMILTLLFIKKLITKIRWLGYKASTVVKTNV